MVFVRDSSFSTAANHRTFTPTTPPPSTTTKNAVHLKLHKELQLGRIASPFSSPPFSPFKISPLTVREKKEPGKVRRLYNISYPMITGLLTLNKYRYCGCLPEYTDTS